MVQTSSLEMSAAIDPLKEREIIREEQARVFGSFVGKRALMVPLFISLLLGIAWFEPLGWRRAFLVALSIAIPLFFLVELRRYRRVGLEPQSIPRNVVLTAAAQLSLSAATGGMLSPFLYGVFPIAGVAGTFLEKRARLALTLVQISVVFGFALLAATARPAEFAGSALGGGQAGLPASHYYVHAGVLSAVLLGVGQVSHLLSTAFASSFRRAMSARHELLVSYADRVKELTTLSAEIAHELKNPLASIKGLSALLTQNVSDERGVERLRVLRREIDRMQSVMEEFLNFSRPLVPLSLRRCDLGDLGNEVVALHEGLARQRAVRLVCSGPQLAVDCDPRKVKQILINLVQNALEATPGDGEVEVAVHERGADAIVVVVDDGSGLPLDLGDVFEPGITSKSGGAGIGLTIARALARQHGGELSLQPRETGGTRAELRLPKHPQILPGSGAP